MFYLNLPGFFICIHISIISEIYFVCLFFLQIEQSLRIGIINASFCCVATQLVHINVSKVSNCCNTTSSYECFKVPLRPNFRYLIFFHFCVQCGYLTYLAEFQAITSTGSLLMGAVSFEISHPPLLCLVPETRLKSSLRITGSDVKGSSRKLTWLILCRVLHCKQHHQRLSFMIKVVFRFIFGA